MSGRPTLADQCRSPPLGSTTASWIFPARFAVLALFKQVVGNFYLPFGDESAAAADLDRRHRPALKFGRGTEIARPSHCYALHDVQHVVTLLGYAAALAAARGDEELRTLCAAGEERLARHERAVRDAIVALGARPDDAIAPAVPSAAGRIGQRIAAAGGALGEWVDRRSIARRAAS